MPVCTHYRTEKGHVPSVSMVVRRGCFLERRGRRCNQRPRTICPDSFSTCAYCQTRAYHTPPVLCFALVVRTIVGPLICTVARSSYSTVGTVAGPSHNNCNVRMQPSVASRPILQERGSCNLGEPLDADMDVRYAWLRQD